MFPGSELDWDNARSAGAGVAEFFKYMVFESSAGPRWDIRDFNFDRDYKRLGLASIYTDNNPDLRKFKAAGGKLLVAQGGSDTLEIPGAIFDYYDTVARTMGGLAPTQEFFRLFLIPGMQHCSGGDGAFAVDYLSYLEEWVLHDHVPDRIVGAHVQDSYLLQHSEHEGSSIQDRIWISALKLPFPLDPAAPVTFRRPAFAYPLRTKYLGRGDPKDAANFGPVEP